MAPVPGNPPGRPGREGGDMPGGLDEPVVSALNRLLARALRGLAEAGEGDAACRLAGEAWSLLRHRYPREAQRMNGLLHALVQLPPRVAGEPGARQAEPERPGGEPSEPGEPAGEPR